MVKHNLNINKSFKTIIIFPRTSKIFDKSAKGQGWRSHPSSCSTAGRSWQRGGHQHIIPHRDHAVAAGQHGS